MTMFTFAVTFNAESENGAAANLRNAIRDHSGYDGPLIIKNLKRMMSKVSSIYALRNRVFPIEGLHS